MFLVVGAPPTTPRMFLGVGPDVLGSLLGGEADNYVETCYEFEFL